MRNILPKTFQTTDWKWWNDPDDPVLSEAFRGTDKYEPTWSLYLGICKKHGSDPVSYSSWYNKEDDDFDPTKGPVEGEEYTKWQIEQMADAMLRADSKREMCRQCGKYGIETGEVESALAVDDEGNPQYDEEGNSLYVEFPELACEDDHRWYKGEGRARTIQGKNPILFENHLQDRRRREILTVGGTPDPSIKRGMYNRTHPQGRKVNTKEQRKNNGASFFR